jgi:hypothetical protein
MIEEEVIIQVKSKIDKGDLSDIKELWEDYENTDFGRVLAWEYIFQKVYIHAALKKKSEICKWLETLYEKLDPIQKIGIRHSFSYGKYLLNR